MQGYLPQSVSRTTVLVVEDDPSVRTLLLELVRLQGYEVVAAADPAEALQQAEVRGGRIQLLLTDVVLPQMRGPELALRLLERCPGMAVVYISGYRDDDLDDLGVPLAGWPFVHKPFPIEALASTLQAALANRAGPRKSARRSLPQEHWAR